MKRWEIYLELFIEIGSIFVWAFLLLFVVPKCMAFCWPFVAALIVAAIANPFCKWLEKKLKIDKKIGSFIMIMIVLLAVAGTLYYLMMVISKQAISLGASLPDLIDNVQGALAEISKKINIDFGYGVISIPSVVTEDINSIMTSLSDSIHSLAEGIADNSIQYAKTVASSVTNGVVGFIVTLMAAYFMMASKETPYEKMKKILPKKMKERLLFINKNLVDALGNYIWAQVKIMFIIALIVFVFMLIGRIPYSLLLAIIIAIIDLIPFLGTGFVLWPWTVYCIIVGDYKHAILFVLLYVICLLARQLLQPKIIGDSVGLSPLLTLFLIYVGFKIGGFGGFIVSILLAVCLVNLYRAGLFDEKKERIKNLYQKLQDTKLP